MTQTNGSVAANQAADPSPADTASPAADQSNQANAATATVDDSRNQPLGAGQAIGETKPPIDETKSPIDESKPSIDESKPSIGESGPRNLEEPILQFFSFLHLPPPLKAASAPFAELAIAIVSNIGPGTERSVALRKLLEAKDAAVRAVAFPGS